MDISLPEQWRERGRAVCALAESKTTQLGLGLPKMNTHVWARVLVVVKTVRLEETDWETGRSSANKPGSQPPLLLSVIDALMGEGGWKARGTRRWTSPDQSFKTKRSVGRRTRKQCSCQTREGKSR